MSGSVSPSSQMELLEDRLFLAATPVAPPVFGGGLTAIGKTAYFTGKTARTGTEIWKTDGTAPGTKLVKDIVRGAASSEPTRLIASGKNLFFRAIDKQGPGLWVTRGTGASTIKLSRLDYTGYAATRNALYFVAWHLKKPELWKTDGTKAGTKFVAKLPHDPQQLIAANNVVFINFAGSQIWISDGTAAGTKLITNYTSATGGWQNQVTVGDALLYEATDGGSQQLWRADASGAVPIGPGGDDLAGDSFVTMGQKLYYLVKGNPDDDLWCSDGTALGTVKVATLPTPHKAGDDGEMLAIPRPNAVAGNGKIYAFYQYDDQYDGTLELWKIEPATGEMNKVKVFSAFHDPNDEYPTVRVSEFVSTSKGLAFNVDLDDPSLTPLAYCSNGTTAGTAPISNKPAGFEIRQPVNASGQVFFIHSSPVATNRLWVWNYAGKKPPRRV